MTTMEPGAAPNLIERVKNILLTPAAEWDRIKPEQTSFQQLIVSYALPLIGIAAVCAFIGMAFIGAAFGPIGMVPALVLLALTVVLQVAFVWVLGFIINAIAPTFGSAQNPMQANKVAIYSATAGWVGGIFNIVPLLGILATISGLYGLYILWLGLPKLMETPEDKKVGYFVTVLLIAILVFAVIGMIMSAVMFSLVGSAILGAAAAGARGF